MDRVLRNLERSGDSVRVLRSKIRAGIIHREKAWLLAYAGDEDARQATDWDGEDWCKFMMVLPNHVNRRGCIRICGRLCILVQQEGASNKALMYPGSWYTERRGVLEASYDFNRCGQIVNLRVLGVEIQTYIPDVVNFKDNSLQALDQYRLGRIHAAISDLIMLLYKKQALPLSYVERKILEEAKDWPSASRLIGGILEDSNMQHLRKMMRSIRNWRDATRDCLEDCRSVLIEEEMTEWIQPILLKELRGN